MKLGCDEGGVVALKSTSPKQEVEMTAAIIPRPAAVKTKRGAFELGVLTSIVADKTLLRQARLLQNALVAPTGYDLPIVGRSAGHRSSCG
jgi:Glycosyl hydrolase family 20, domain 2